MKIKDVFWKWKRAIRRNKETISRVFSICLIVLLVAVVGYAAFNIYQSDRRREEEANRDKNKESITALKKYDYGPEGFQKVAENEKLILSADFTTGEIEVTEKESGMKWYSNPQDRSNDNLAPIKSRVNSQIHVKFMNVEKGVTVEFDNYAGSIKKGRMEHKLVENGVKFVFGFPTANVYIPVQYTLCEGGFQAEVITSEIKGVGDGAFLVESIALLPFFGAGNLEDEGYLFVPDGSGALIEFNNNKQNYLSYSAPVYGKNPTMEKVEEETVRERISLPVFGAKCNDHAFFGIITSGEACSTISATTSKKDSSYNHVYPTAVLREYNLLHVQHNAEAYNDSHTIDYSDDLMDGNNYAVRYFFLEGDQANYSGMSNLYREYLEERNLLKKSELADKKYMVLDLVGAVSIKKYVMGIKMPVVTAMTTYNEVCEIVKELKAQGVENIIVNYIGAMDSGLNNKMFNKVSNESVLGSKKEFRQMVSYLEQEGVLLFLETNPVDLYENGKGYSENDDSVRTFFNKYAFQYKYNLDLGTPIENTRWHLLRPQLAADLTADFAKSLASWNINQISLARLGEVIYSDYVRGENYLSRTQALKVWDQALKMADENLEYVMVHGGNAYCAPYADVITDVANSHSSFDMEDQSVPFYQMTLQDSALMTANGINTTVDYEYAFLKAIETGCSLKYNLIYGDVSQLVGTDFNTMVSYSYDYWKNLAVEEYLAMQEAVGQFAGEEIIGHELLEEDVSLTKYESAEVVVNYRNEAYTYRGMEIGARDYLVLPGGAK